MVQAGYYSHYKGGIYKVIGMAKHSETEEDLVLYCSVDLVVWARPASMWFEEVNGKTRFTRFESQHAGETAFEMGKEKFIRTKGET